MQQLARTSRIGRIQEQGKPVEEPENPDGGKKMAVKDESPKLQPGTRFGRLVVVEAAKTVQKVKMSLCKCDCGSIVSVRNCHLLSGHTRSCGCLAREAKPKNPNKMSGTPLYKVWDGMKYRCYSPNAPQYHNYGSRGITMCDEWHKSYRAFRDWAISNGYQPGLSLDRIDNDGNYEPSNCRWTDSVEQGRNRRTNIIIEYKGEKKTVAEWAEYTGLYYTTILERYRKGWTPEEIIETPKRVYARGGKKGKRDFVKFSLFVNPLLLSTGQQKKMNFATKMIFTDSRVANGMRMIELAARPHTREVHSVCPPGTRVALTIIFLCPYPEGVKESERIERAPMGEQFDCDNKYKAIGDALTNAGWWEDDRHVTTLHIEKRRTVATPRIEVVVEPDTKRPIATVNDEDELADSPIESVSEEPSDNYLFELENI